MSVVTKLKFLLQAIDNGGLAENIVSPARHLFDHSYRWGSGTDDGTVAGIPAKFDKVWSDRRTLGATSSETIDLAGSLTNSFGVTVTFVELCALLIVNRTTTSTSSLLVGQNSATSVAGFWSQGGTYNLGVDFPLARSVVDPAVAGPPIVYGMLWKLSPRGFAVGAGSTDLLYVGTPSTGATYDICLIGRSA
jgi:hypothetical protein